MLEIGNSFNKRCTNSPSISSFPRFSTGKNAHNEIGSITPLINWPLSKALLAPVRKYSDTVPGVSGLHFNVVGWPAVSENPGGIWNALLCAAARRNSDRARGRRNRVGCIFWKGQILDVVCRKDWGYGEGIYVRDMYARMNASMYVRVDYRPM